MSDHHTFFGKLIAGILSIFKSSAVKIWDSLTPEEQASIKNGANIINLINTHIDDDAEIIKAEILKAYPNEPDIEAKLIELAKLFNITLPTVDLIGAINAIKTFLASKEGTVWQWASSSLAQALSVLFTPGLTVFAKIAMVIEFAYNTYIKNH